jgi:L-iditol 2-dehydrogenase
MQALLLSDYRRLELVDIDCPAVGRNDVLVRVAACGICGSDVHGYDGSTGRRVPPIVMGHEAAGVVEAVGDMVDRQWIGKKVTFDSTISCGHCEACRNGQSNLCPQRRILGVSCDEFRQNGAFAEFVAVPQHILYALADGFPIEQAAFTEPVSVAVHAVDRVRHWLGDCAVVVGSGMIGLLVIQALRHAGCREVIAVDINPGRLNLAHQLGATFAINSKDTDPIAAVLNRTAGRGAEIAMEVVGNSLALGTAIGAVRRGGSVCLIGNVSPEVRLPLQAVVARELTLLGSCASAGEYPRAIDMLASGVIRVEPLISAIAPLADGPQWFERLYSAEPNLMKVILKP